MVKVVTQSLAHKFLCNLAVLLRSTKGERFIISVARINGAFVCLRLDTNLAATRIFQGLFVGRRTVVHFDLAFTTFSNILYIAPNPYFAIENSVSVHKSRAIGHFFDSRPSDYPRCRIQVFVSIGDDKMEMHCTRFHFVSANFLGFKRLGDESYISLVSQKVKINVFKLE